MNIGFTGTQQGMTPAQKVTLSNLLSVLHCSNFHHGDCIGADAEAHEIAYPRYHTVIHPPLNDYKRAFCKGSAYLPPEDYRSRNARIVTVTSYLIAAPKGFDEELRSGTWMTVRIARKIKYYAGIFIIWPNGQIKLER